MSRTPVEALIVGGEPRVNLLPPEVRSGNKVRIVRRRLGVVLLGVIILVAGGVTAATTVAITTEVQLAVAQARTDALFAEQAKYSEVRLVENNIALIAAAREAGAATEVNWDGYLAEVRTRLPSEITIDTVAVDSAPPFQPYAQATAPLQQARVATLTLSLTSRSLPEVPAWLGALEDLPGYADGAPSSILRDDTGSFTVTLVLHISDGAHSNRFAPATEE